MLPSASAQACPSASTTLIDSPQAWVRLWIALALMTIGGSGMYVVLVVLPSVQADFGITRAQAALPYALTMIGFGVGGILMGRLSDRFGVALPLLFACVSIGVGFIVAGLAPNYWVFALAQGVLIGLLGCAATFSPLMTDISFWFERRRGIAVAICAGGNYLAGALWPPITQWGVEQIGWRHTYVAIGAFCMASMFPLAVWLHRGTGASKALRVESQQKLMRAQAGNAGADRPLGMAPQLLFFLLCVAGVACCVAMAMPQVHIVAYCSDLGYGVARGAQMLSIMLAFGVVSRLLSGLICDRIGGLRTLILGSTLQMVALWLFIPFDGMESLFMISALFGLFQGGIVPSYAIIVRELFSPLRAGAYIGTVMMATMVGMALGGWMSGKIFDITGSYQAAFLNGIAWNALNLSIALYLLYRSRRGGLKREREPVAA
jgi:MFS family permease